MMRIVLQTSVRRSGVLQRRRWFDFPLNTQKCHTAGAATLSPRPTLADPVWRAPPSNTRVANWLYVCAAVVGAVVWIGGVTRLTESGLSIVEWKPLSGVIPPLTRAEWEAEFAHYQRYPEFQQRTDMTLSDFRYIFYWEWAHRVLARSLGVVYGVPLVYYTCRGRFKGQGSFLAGLVGILCLGGAQGFMGWYMVRSGLDKKLLEERRKVTVSAYRLASHLCLAFAIYASMLRMGYALKLPRYVDFPRRPLVQLWARISCGTMLVTAMTGAFVAGLDAGLLYNDGFPLMAGSIIPPLDHLMPLEPRWRNLFENNATVQTVHRLMAGTTFLCITALNVAASRRRGAIPSRVRRTLMCVNGALLVQVGLGMWTIISYVDVPVAASHQVGALVLLATLLRMCAVVGSRGTMLA